MGFEQLGTIAIAGYVIWMAVTGHTHWWSRRDHPNAARWLNHRDVFRDEEPGVFWAVIAFHVVLVAAMIYIAFLK